MSRLTMRSMNATAAAGNAAGLITVQLHPFASRCDSGTGRGTGAWK